MEYSEKIINAFTNECTDLMNTMEEKILLLEKEPDNKEHINEIFRIVHSLKSETALMGFTHFSTLAHKLEDLFQQIRSGTMPVNDTIIEVVFRIYDEFKALFHHILNHKSDEYAIEDSLQLIDSVMIEVKTKKETTPDAPPSEDIVLSSKEILQLSKKNLKNLFNIKINIFENVALKYARAYLIYNNLSATGEIIRTSVSFEKEEDDSRYRAFTIILLTNNSEKEIYDLIDVSEVERVSVKKIPFTEEAAKPEEKETTEDITANSIRVDTDKIENLMTTVGELIVNYNRTEKFYEFLNNNNFTFTKSVKTTFMDIISQFKRIIDSLQDDVMKVRMVPIKTLFDKFPRLIRNLAKELDKKVTLSISGEYTEVDKTVIEEIREPLTHIIRNSIDHGIESAKERKKKGKNIQGTLKISSFQSGNNIVIKITDDGKGIDLEKIKEKVISNNLIEKEKLPVLNDNQLLEFIFQPGFSTKETVTEVSGRGVGMDIVRNNIRKLQGKINLITKKDKGTSVIISIPLTIAIVNSLIISCRNIYYAIPLYFIQETLRIYQEDIQIADKFEVIPLRKKLLSIIRLNQILNIKNLEQTEVEEQPDILSSFRKKPRQKHFVVVINFGSKQIGLIVDKLISEQDIVIKPLTQYIEKTEGVSGVTILGDGNIAYILDPIKLITYYLNKKMLENEEFSKLPSLPF